MKVRFTASGFGSEILNYKDEDDLFGDIHCTIEEHQGELQDYKNGEYVVINSNGEEVGRWEIL